MEQNVEEFVDKKVTLVKKLAEPNSEGHTLVELEGVIEAASAIGVLFRQRGRTNGELVKTDEIEDLRPLSTAPKPVKIKALKRMNLETVRQHLVDRHGDSVKAVNQITEEVAMKRHEDMHKDANHGNDLAHNHGDVATVES